jgi:hypothetical protein
MSKASQDHTPPSDPPPRLAVRRYQDRCFHPVEEVIDGEGYIVQGILFPLDEIAQVRVLEDGPDS